MLLLSSQSSSMLLQPAPQGLSTETYPIILRLSLVRHLVGKLNHPGPGAELKELDPPKRLGKQVRKLVLRC